MRAPDIFQLDDVDGHATAAPGQVPPDQEDAAREAALSCPEQAIALS